jgi:deoxyribodipyrimidine photo-lyase
MTDRAAGGRTAIVWFRRDLRLHDHPALHLAIRSADRVVPAFILDDALLRGRHGSAARAAFMLASLEALAADLAARGAPLVVRSGPPAAAIAALAAETETTDVFVSRDVGPYARARDGAVAAALAAEGRRLHAMSGLLVVEPEDLLTGEGRPYTVFTPYARRWAATPRRVPFPAPMRIVGHPDLGPERAGRVPTIGDLGIPAPSLRDIPAAGEAAARARLDRWVASGLDAYADRRDLLGADGTSRLSQDIRWGLLSPVEVLDRAGGAGEGRRTFASELAWRDFYSQVLFHFPHAARGSFRPVYDGLPWRDDPVGLDAWRDGRTGFPVVDAAMRQLAATGWMHNRARMIVASFLAKDLLLDWRAGERHFMERLVDGDLASNNGGWQWAAGAGTDAQPWFRIFDPVAQGRRHDPDGAYVRRWIPELSHVPDRHVHAPWAMPADVASAAGVVVGRDYPAPIVDHAAARRRALEAYRSVRVDAGQGRAGEPLSPDPRPRP